jgi:uncharacterized protein YsxB (DUF464 family)
MIKIIHEPGRITVAGHAGFAPPGQDVVCSAISVLVQTLSRSIAQLTDDMAEGLEIPGKTIIITEHLSDKRAKLLVDAFFIGVNGVAEAYAAGATAATDQQEASEVTVNPFDAFLQDPKNPKNQAEFDRLFLALQTKEANLTAQQQNPIEGGIRGFGGA